MSSTDCRKAESTEVLIDLQRRPTGSLTDCRCHWRNKRKRGERWDGTGTPNQPAIPNRKPVTLAPLCCQDRNGLRQELSNPTWRYWVGRSALLPLLIPITCQTWSEVTRHIFFSACGTERSRRMKRQNDAKTRHGINLNDIFTIFATQGPWWVGGAKEGAARIPGWGLIDML